MRIRIYHDPGEERKAHNVMAYARGLSPDSDVWAAGTDSHNELYRGIIENPERMDEQALRLAYWATLELSKGLRAIKRGRQHEQARTVHL